jgi:hypothetical protein
MSLPQLKSPVYVLTLPSTGKPVKFSSFLVRDEKALSLAMMDSRNEVIASTLKEIIKNCTFGQLDVDKLSSFDIEYIFLQLRAKSRGNIIDLEYVCKNEIEGVVCDQKNNFSIDLEKITVDMKNAPSCKIMLNDTVGIVMKYPTLDNVLDIQMALANKDINVIYDKMRDFVECVFEGEKVETNFTNNEFSTWLGTLDQKQFKKIEEWFKTLPTVKSHSNVCCKKCGHKDEIDLEGLSSFLS